MFWYRFGLSESPFARVADPRFISWTDEFRRTYDAIRADILSGVPAVALTGQTGLGKSLLLSALAVDPRVSKARHVVHLQAAPYHRAALIQTVTELLDDRAGSDLATRDDQDETPSDIDELSSAIRRADRDVVLLLDDLTAKSTDAVLDLLRLAGELSSLSLVLVGQAEVRTLIARMAQNESDLPEPGHYQLHPLGAEDAAIYVSDRMAQAGGSPDIFAPDAVALLNDVAGGVPSAIDAVGTACLAHAFGERRWIVDRDLAARFLTKTAANFLTKTDDRSYADLAARDDRSPREDGARLRTVLGERRATDMPRTPVGSRQQAPAPGMGRADNRPAAARQSGESRPPAPEFRRNAPAEAPDAGHRADRAGEAATRSPEIKSSQLLQQQTVPRHHAPAKSRVPWVAGAVALVSVSAALLVLLPVLLPSDAPEVEFADDGDSTDIAAAPTAVEAPEPLLREPVEVEEPPAPLPDNSEIAEVASEETPGEEAVQPTAPTGPAPELEALAPSSEAEADAEQFYRAGLLGEMASSNAIAFARGAMRGHQRSALYLGQMYETGDGVSYAPRIAARWYAVADDASPDEIDVAAASDVTPIFASGEDDSIDLVWDGSANSFLVEIADENRDLLGRIETPLTAVRVADPGGAAFWRVSNAGDRAAEWTPITFERDDP